MSGALRLTNTFSKQLEPFEPLHADGKTVLLYSCGPTVYSFAHIGNFRSFLMSDILRRVLERSGFTVRHVMNITDVGHMTQDHLADASGEDKLSKAARELGWDPYEVAQHFQDAFAADAKALRLRNYLGAEAEAEDLHPRATRHVPEMLAMIQTLIERGHAYLDSEGQAYFSIASFEEYGRLSHKDIDELIAGARVEVRGEKKDPRDFALWKVDDKHLMQWDPHSAEGWIEEDRRRLDALVPGGIDPRLKKGFPGWHIECSAMARRCLGDLIDIHTGGEDNLFPHHECENAQTCGALDSVVPGPDGEARRSFAKYWLHARFLLVDGRKMSKRDGTFYTVKDLLHPLESKRPDLAQRLTEAGFEGGSVPPPVLRLALIWGHYRQSMNFSMDMLGQARAGLSRLQSLYDRVTENAEPGQASEAVSTAIEAGLAAFDAALLDDLRVDRAIPAALELVDQLNRLELSPADGAAIQAALENIDEVLDVLTRRRLGVIARGDLARWLEADFRRSRAEALAAWRNAPDRLALIEALAQGELPSKEALVAVEGELDDDLIDLFIGIREASRKTRDFATADALRDELKRRGVVVQDSPDAIHWKIA